MKLVRLEDATPETILDLEGRELSAEELAEVYRLAREAFTAADLQRYTELDEGVSAAAVLQEMEEVQQQADQRAE